MDSSKISSTDSGTNIPKLDVNPQDSDPNPTTNAQMTKGMSAQDIVSYNRIALFVCTTVLIWMSEPLLSLVDTTIVGNFPSYNAVQNLKHGISTETIQLAALGPATMLCDNFIYVSYFLPIAVTNQLATAEATSDDVMKMKFTSNALGIAILLGCLICIMINIGGGSLLSLCIGKEGAIVNGMDMTSTVKSLAWDYAKIRGYVAPIIVMGIVAQTISLTTLDTVTPALAVISATILNVIGDVLLVAKYKMGIRGAAIATAVAGAVSASILIHETKKKMSLWRSNQDCECSGDAVKDGRGFENTGQEYPSLISLPDLKSLLGFVKLAGPIFFVIVGKMICYSIMTVRAADFGLLSLTTHTIMIRIFFFFCTFGDSFSQAAQTFLPSALYSTSRSKEASRHDEIEEVNGSTSNREGSEANALLKRIMILSCVSAFGCAFLSRFIAMSCGSIFTNDATIKHLLSLPQHTLYLMSSVCIHPITMVLEGALIAARDLRFLVGAYGITISALMALLKYASPSFSGVWRSLLLFQIIRCSLFGSRVFKKYRTR